jgi:hypothetical protein
MPVGLPLSLYDVTNGSIRVATAGAGIGEAQAAHQP